MNIIEIPVIGSRNNQIEKFFYLLSNNSLRNFEGLDLGILHLDSNFQVYFYFLNQDNEQYYYIWDLVIPHAPGCILIFNWEDPRSIESNLKTIEYVEKRFLTPLHICSLPSYQDIPDDLIKEELQIHGNRRIYTFDPERKDSAKEILRGVFDNNNGEE